MCCMFLTAGTALGSMGGMGRIGLWPWRQPCGFRPGDQLPAQPLQKHIPGPWAETSPSCHQSLKGVWWQLVSSLLPARGPWIFAQTAGGRLGQVGGKPLCSWPRFQFLLPHHSLVTPLHF
jgi:hypothetical protein